MTDLNQRAIVNLAKTRPPQHADELVERQCLSLLRETHQSGIHCFLAAPAGFGKTSLLVQYFNQLQADNNHVAWLSLSESDADPVHLLAGVSYAIQSLGRNVGGASQALIGTGFAVSYQVILTTLINEILSFGEPITLFLDDLHRADSTDVESMMLEIMESGPGNLRLILASRTAFPRFGRLRARKRLIEVTAEDLRVTYPEAEAFLSRTNPLNLSSDHVYSLLDHVDGWINGLQIAALSINEETDIESYIKGFTGRGTDFSDYIEHDIFERLPDPVKDFLIETSVLEILTPELCDAVTQRNDSESILVQLRQMNLFLVTLDQQLSCYRYHHIFREFLRSKLSAKPGGDLNLIHRRAYTWCMSHDLRREAISHILATEDWDGAARAIDDSLEVALSKSRLSTLETWIQTLPEEYINTRPSLQLGLGWVAILRREFSAASECVAKAEELFARAKESGELDEASQKRLGSNVVAQKSVITVVRDRANEVAEFAECTDINVPEDQPFFRETYTASLVYALMNQGKFDEGHRLAIDSEVSSRSNNVRAIVYTQIFRGLGYRLAGHYQQAKERYQQAQQVAGQKFGDLLVPFSVPCALMAEIYYEWGDFESATEQLKNSSIIRQESSIIEPLLCIYQVSSRLAVIDGNLEYALQLLAEGEAVGRQDQYDRLVAAMLCERIRLLIRTGDLEPAAAAYADLEKLKALAISPKVDSRERWSELDYYIDMGRSRYYTATQKLEEAISLLQRLSVMAKRQGQQRHLVDILLLEASALNHQGKHRSVLNRLAEAIRLGERGRFMQTYLDVEPQLREPLRKTLTRWSPEDELCKTPAGIEYLEALKDKLGVDESPVDDNEVDVDIQDIEPLTPREIDLLRLLAKGLKNKELAREMNVSHHTIAWHLKNLYAKLNVDNRTAAVTVARHLRL